MSFCEIKNVLVREEGRFWRCDADRFWEIFWVKLENDAMEAGLQLWFDLLIACHRFAVEPGCGGFAIDGKFQRDCAVLGDAKLGCAEHGRGRDAVRRRSGVFQIGPDQVTIDKRRGKPPLFGRPIGRHDLVITELFRAL